MEQSQFLDVLDRDEAERRFRAGLDLAPLGVETVPLAAAPGRVLAGDVEAGADVPGFTRSNVDGFAVRAADTFGSGEERPRLLRLNAETLHPGVEPRLTVAAGTATPLATGGILPRGADAVVMVEHTQPAGSGIEVRRAVAPGAHLAQAGSDIARGETVLRAGAPITSREVGVLAALGRDSVEVFSRPRVAIMSTGDEVVAPGRPLAMGQVYDANAAVLAAAVVELGGEPLDLGIVPDSEEAVAAALLQGLERSDMVLLSGGTSKGAGDINARVVERICSPGILAHGVALKPGKPICLAAHGGRAVVILPGFPTSAVFTFHEFVAPVIRQLTGRPPRRLHRTRARVPARLNSEVGRTEYTLVGLVQPGPAATGADQGIAPGLPVAVPLGKGSGSVTAFGAADGFITIPRQAEYLEAGEIVEVTMLGHELEPADLVIQGSHCLGLDLVIAALRQRGFTARVLAVGSSAGLAAVAAGHADLAGIHLYDTAGGEYNRPFLPPGVELLPGYGRLQGLVFRQGDARFEGREARAAAAAAVSAATSDPDSAPVLISRNRGSGTRALLDELLAGCRPPGSSHEARSHHAVAAAVAQGRADWGLAIAPVARLNGLGFLPLKEERFDFALRAGRRGEPALAAFAAALGESQVRQRLQAAGFTA